MGTGPYKGRADYLELGDYNAACSMCGRKRKASQMVRNWQGLYRCPEHNEPRQPQDFVRSTKDVMTVPWAQPQEDIFVYTCSLETSSSVPGLAGPGCMIPGRPYMGQVPPGPPAPPPVIDSVLLVDLVPDFLMVDPLNNLAYNVTTATVLVSNTGALIVTENTVMLSE